MRAHNYTALQLPLIGRFGRGQPSGLCAQRHTDHPVRRDTTRPPWCPGLPIISADIAAGASRASWPAGGPAAGYGRGLVNGTLSVKASFAGQLFRLHRQSAGVLRLFVPGRLAWRPLRGLGPAGPLEQPAPGPETKHASALAI